MKEKPNENLQYFRNMGEYNSWKENSSNDVSNSSNETAARSQHIQTITEPKKPSK